MKNVFKVVSVVMVLALLVGVMAATGLLASAADPDAITTWSDKGGIDYTYYYQGRAYANMYKGCAGTNGTWGEFAEKNAEIPDNQYLKVVVTGTFAGVTAENVYMKSRVWKETGVNIYADSATENEVVFRVQGPLTSAFTGDPAIDNPNIDLVFNADMTAISESGDTHITVSIHEGDAEVIATATEAEPEETETEPEATATEPVVTEPSETEPSETEPVVTEPSETKPSTPVVLLYGDANADNEINMKDVLTLRKYLAGMEVEINMTLADANGDDEINMKDVLALRKYLAGMDQVLGK